MFRRLNWIVEQIDADGTSRVSGIYTSIPDLTHEGLKWLPGNSPKLRLSLWKPDHFGEPLGVWDGGSMQASDLQAFVDSKEYSESEVAELMVELAKFTG